MADESMIDWEQLNLVSDYDVENRGVLIEIFLKGTRDDFAPLRTAIDQKNVSEVARLSHGAAGASMSYGMSILVPGLRKMEADAKNGSLENAETLYREFQQNFVRLEKYLSAAAFPAINRPKAA